MGRGRAAAPARAPDAGRAPAGRAPARAAPAGLLRGRAGLVRRRRRRPLLVHAVPARARGGAAAGAVGHGRDLRRAGGARRAPGGGARGRLVLRAEPLRDRDPVPPGRRAPAGSAATARSGSRTSAGCSRSRESSCEPALGGAPRRARRDRAAPRLRPARRAVRPLPCRRQRAPARARGDLAPPRPRELGGRAARVPAPARARRRDRDPHLPPARVRAGDALPAPRRGEAAGAPGAARGGGARPAPRAGRAAAEARRRAPLLPRRVPPRRAARRRLAQRPARAAPRAPGRERGRRRVPRRRGRAGKG